MYQTKIIELAVDGVSDWVWPRNDKGLWLGPSQEWPRHKERILEHCTSFGTVVQAGGACGMYPKLLSKMFKKVYTFEPDHYNFYCLAQNCIEDNIYKFNCALGDRHGNITFNYPSEENRGVGTTNFDGIKDEEPWIGNIPLLRVDDFVFENLGLIYLDIEGSERHALNGALNTIEKFKPLIICENGHAGIIDIIAKFGYKDVCREGADTFFKCESL